MQSHHPVIDYFLKTAFPNVFYSSQTKFHITKLVQLVILMTQIGTNKCFI